MIRAYSAQMSTRLRLSRYLELLESDTERIASTCESADLASPVASCPGWTLGDLAEHVGGVHRFWHWVAREQPLDVGRDTDIPRSQPPPGPAIGQWLRDGLAEFIPLLRDGDPATPLWSWTSQHELAFIQRRMPQETAVHRWDAESVIGAPRPIAADLAADGIEEFFFLASAADPTEGRERVRLRATDAGHAWVADVVDGMQVLETSDGDDEVEAEIAGSASDLLLVLWRRKRPADAQISGNPNSVRRFLDRADLT
jgi:uncharacterized protein (TIGR03083 family)